MSEPEIERKFLLKNDTWQQDNITSVIHIIQCCVVIADQYYERVRVSETFGFTAAYYTKKTYVSERVRDEDEQPISVIHAVDLMTTSSNICIPKTRYCIERDDVVWEIDVFSGDKFQGLELVEIELKIEDQDFVHPDWLGEEITDQAKYNSLELTKNPFLDW